MNDQSSGRYALDVIIRSALHGGISARRHIARRGISAAWRQHQRLRRLRRGAADIALLSWHRRRVANNVRQEVRIR